MRQVFFTLVGMNLLILGWGFLFAEDSSTRGVREVGANSSPGRIAQGAPRNVEKPNAAVPQLGGQGASVGDSPEREKEEKVEPQALCEIVGPFSVDSEVEAFMERLSSIDVRSSRHELELSVGSNYWVLLPAKASRKEAQRELKKLQSLGVDSYVVPKGDYANAISLGMFTKKGLADAVVDNLKSKKYNPTLKVIDRTQIETWVMVSPQDADNMSDLTWNRVMKELNNQERRQNFCLDVASE